MLRKYRDHIIVFACFLTMFLLWTVVQKYHLIYLEQHSLFLFDSNFLSHFFTQPGELAIYASRFFTQFFIYPVLGASVLSILSLILFLQFKRIFRKRTGTNTILFPLLPVLVLNFILLDTQNHLDFFISAILFCLCIDGYTSIKQIKIKFIFGSFSLIGLYFICGDFFAALAVFYILFDLTTLKSNSRFYISIIYLTIFILCPFLSRYYLFVIHLKDAYLPITLGENIFGEFSKIYKSVFILLLIFFAGIPIFVRFLNKIQKKANGYWIFECVSIVGLFIVMGYSFFTPRNKLLWEKIEYLSDRESWSEIQFICDTYWKEKTGEPELPLDMFLAQYTKLANIMNLNLPESYLNYNPQYSFGMLFPYNLREEDRDGHTYFFDKLCFELNMYTIARERDISFFDLKKTTVKSILNVVKCNIILDDSLYNILYERRLSKTLFYKNFTKNLKANKEYLDRKRAFATDSGYEDPRSTTDLLISSFSDVAPNNRYAFEYGLMAHLFDYKNHNLVLHAFQKEDRVKNFNYEHIPTYFEEALLVAIDYGNNASITKDSVLSMDFSGLKIREQTVNRCDQFFEKKNRYALGMLKYKHLEKEFQNTYWFHLLYNEVPINGDPDTKR